MKPLQTGLALSVTVAVFYSLCAQVEALWPAQFMGFMNALFHAMDFRLHVATHMTRTLVTKLLRRLNRKSPPALGTLTFSFSGRMH